MLFHLYSVPFLSHRHSYARYPKASEIAGALRNILPLFPTQAYLYSRYPYGLKGGRPLPPSSLNKHCYMQDILKASEMAGVLRNIYSMELG